MLKQFLKGMAVAVVATAVGLGCATQTYAQSRAVNGKVTDSKGEPVIGASVFVVGSTNHGTETDLEGNYSLSVPSGASLNFSCIGYATEIVPVGDRTVINVTPLRTGGCQQKPCPESKLVVFSISIKTLYR